MPKVLSEKMVVKPTRPRLGNTGKMITQHLLTKEMLEGRPTIKIPRDRRSNSNHHAIHSKYSQSDAKAKFCPAFASEVCLTRTLPYFHPEVQPSKR